MSSVEIRASPDVHRGLSWRAAMVASVVVNQAETGVLFIAYVRIAAEELSGRRRCGALFLPRVWL
jgi:hypothetical protein